MVGYTTNLDTPIYRWEKAVGIVTPRKRKRDNEEPGSSKKVRANDDANPCEQKRGKEQVRRTKKPRICSVHFKDGAKSENPTSLSYIPTMNIPKPFPERTLQMLVVSLNSLHCWYYVIYKISINC